MRAVDIIMKKRDGGMLTPEEISFFIKGYVDGSIPDYQASAFCMAVFFKGMVPDEIGVLTREMIASGEVFDLGTLKGPLIDKHSTGGVGDKVSLILAPLAAACGVQIPMMSGRALGHTGGTLDKLEAIPGYSTAVTPEAFSRGIEEVGFMMTGQSKSVVPADRLMYSLRDVTGTVESVPLITASILSKKFAEGAQGLVFDVKCGKGAFMKTQKEAEALASSLVNTGKSLGKKVVAVLTNMDEPLGNMVGNFLEVEESVLCLEGKGPRDLMEITLRLTGWMLVAGGISPTIEEAVALCQKKIESGEALEVFYKNVAFQGGDVEKLKSQLGKIRAQYKETVFAEQDGYVSGIDAMETGLTGVDLGVGRNKTEDDVLPYVGIEFFRKTGDSVRLGDPLCTLYAEDTQKAKNAALRMAKAFSYSKLQPQKGKMIIKEMRAI